jgi:hypothetical protein
MLLKTTSHLRASRIVSCIPFSQSETEVPAVQVALRRRLTHTGSAFVCSKFNSAIVPQNSYTKWRQVAAIAGGSETVPGQGHGTGYIGASRIRTVYVAAGRFSILSENNRAVYVYSYLLIRLSPGTVIVSSDRQNRSQAKHRNRLKLIGLANIQLTNK